MLNAVKCTLRICIRNMYIIQYQILRNRAVAANCIKNRIYFVSLSVVEALLVPVLQHDDADGGNNVVGDG